MGAPDRRYGTVWDLKEQDRFHKQIAIDENKSIDDRRLNGQFSTPYPLAKEIIQYGLKLLGDRKEFSFLEPAVGTGVFFSALLEQINSERLKNAIGYEVDAAYGAVARDIWGDKLQIRAEDFTSAQPDCKIDFLVTNPPYVRHHYISSDTKAALNDLASSETQITLSGLSGLYCYFILLSHKWLSPHAVCGWLLPSEFMDVNYGQELKRYLLDRVRLIRIHRYNPKSVRFDDALVSSAVVWFENIEVQGDYEIEFSFGGTHDQPEITQNVKKSMLAQEPKWTRILQNSKIINAQPNSIKDFFEIKRGLATGDNAFFILDRDQIRKHGLEMSYFEPILPSPRYLKEDYVLADGEGYPLLDKRCFLLNCTLDEADIQKWHPELWTYLEKGKKTVSKKYLCRCRKKWYFQEVRSPAPLLCTYMGRGGKNSNPFRFIKNMSRAVATNSYLMLYPKAEIAGILSENPALLDAIWKYLNALSSEIVESEGRVYGGGLKKIEPKELGNVPCPDLRTILI